MTSFIQTKQQVRIVVPQRPANGGFDFKFESDPYNVKLHDLMTGTEYKDAITQINTAIKPARQTTADTALLGLGVFIVPLAFWGVRHNKLTKKRKRLMKECIEIFNEEHPHLYMRWNRRPDSMLTIERRHAEGGVPDLPNSCAVVLYEKQVKNGNSLPPSGQYVLPGGRPNFHASTSNRQESRQEFDAQHMSEPPQHAVPPFPQQPLYPTEPEIAYQSQLQGHSIQEHSYVPPVQTPVVPLLDLLS